MTTNILDGMLWQVGRLSVGFAPVGGVPIKGGGGHNVAGLQEAGEGVVVHEHSPAEAAAEAAQILHVVLHVRAHRRRPVRSTPSHAGLYLPVPFRHSFDA